MSETPDVSAQQPCIRFPYIYTGNGGAGNTFDERFPPTNVCVWCKMRHLTGLCLCPDHEALAQQLRRERGLPVRQAVAVREEPDD